MKTVCSRPPERVIEQDCDKNITNLFRLGSLGGSGARAGAKRHSFLLGRSPRAGH
jgi:hypothetical protein